MADLTISANVGTGGTNRPVDVRTVQYLLNKVSAADGGPTPALEMRSGICGAKTVAAIRQFQQRQLGSADGIVEPGERTLATLNQLDRQSTDKLVVTNHGALVAKYGAAGVAEIDTAIAALVTADLARGLVTTVVALDDGSAMSALNAPPVTDPADQRQNKAAIDGVCVASLPDYLLLLGAPDIIPHQDLTNPVFQAGVDDDVVVPSDLPYATEAPYSTDVRKFLAPTRVVGRLPDLMAHAHDGTAEPAYLVGLLEQAAAWQATTRADYQDPFASTAAVWSGSSRLSVTNTFGPTADLHLIPAEGPAWPDALVALRSHFINCHGSPIDPTFYGQPADGSSQFPEAHLASLLPGRITAGTVVAAECCYGAELYDPSDQAEGQAGFANTYLGEGAFGFCGSTNIAYGPSDTNDLADLVCQWFLGAVLNGASLGRALLDVRHRYLLEGHTGPTDLKTLAQFLLVGDPSIQPVRDARSHHRALDHGAVESAERAERRDRSRRVATTLSSVPVARAAPDRSLDPDIEAALRRVASQAGRAYTAPLTFVIDAPRRRDLPDEVDAPEAIHLLMSAEIDASVPDRIVHVIEAREQRGMIIGYREYTSR